MSEVAGDSSFYDVIDKTWCNDELSDEEQAQGIQALELRELKVKEELEKAKEELEKRRKKFLSTFTSQKFERLWYGGTDGDTPTPEQVDFILSDIH